MERTGLVIFTFYRGIMKARGQKIIGFLAFKSKIATFIPFPLQNHSKHIHHIIIIMEHDPWVTLFLPHSLLRTRGVRALPTVDRAPLYNYLIFLPRKYTYFV